MTNKTLSAVQSKISKIQQKRPELNALNKAMRGKSTGKKGSRKKMQIKDHQQTWEGLDEIYNQIAVGMAEIARNYDIARGVIARLGAKPPPEVVVNINGLQNDLNSLTDELLRIRAGHKDRKGVINLNDLSISVSIVEDYMVYKTRLEGVLFPSMLAITEFVNEEVIKYHNAKAAEQQQRDLANPNVISDAVVKEG